MEAFMFRLRILSYLTATVLMILPLSGTAASLKGSGAKQEMQNQEADREKLSRIENDSELEEFKLQKLLVPLPTSKAVRVDNRLASKFRWCRPWTARFLRDLGHDYFVTFRTALQVNSAVRTIEYQTALRKRNGNAASTTGDHQSSHPTGATIDIAKKNMTPRELTWMRKKLAHLEDTNLLAATEENRQPVFHIMVFNVRKHKS